MLNLNGVWFHANYNENIVYVETANLSEELKKDKVLLNDKEIKILVVKDNYFSYEELCK